uniref:Hcy-binding domain-containing protein n=1 Tax=Oryza rufipogon TaxID=4529 RepID=A0A0E0N344_ORYRU
MGRGGDVDGAAGALRRFVREAGGCAVVDGGLATELEAHGADLHDELWSASCLVSAPHLIRKVHLDYLDAGANIITSASYQVFDKLLIYIWRLTSAIISVSYIRSHFRMQATIQGFQARGLSRERSEALLRRSVHIAQEARAIFAEGWSKGPYANHRSSPRRPVLVAASIGSYGAYLADGSEYTGDYGISVTKETLKSFHRRRLQVLADAGPDLIAFETIPNKLEAQASGDPITECAAVADACARVGAVGVNCTAPRLVHGLILSIRKVTSKPVVVYPNSGETYVAETKEWVESEGGASETDFVSCVGKWRQAGAALVGGCCRTSPATVRAISWALRESDDAVGGDGDRDDFPAVAVL